LLDQRHGLASQKTRIFHMNFDSKNYRDLRTAAFEEAGRRQINFIYLFIFERRVPSEGWLENLEVVRSVSS